MNPLLNTDVHRYVRDLIDRHIPNEDQEDEAPAGKAEKGGLKPDTDRPSNAKEGKVA